MTDSKRRRDPRFTRAVGEKPNQGRRYVTNGKVRIEWTEDGRRRSRTIGPNGPKTRREADEELERILGLMDKSPEDNKMEEEAVNDGADEVGGDEEKDREEKDILNEDLSWIFEGFRHHADALMDLADDLAESVERGLIQVLNVFKTPEDADASEQEEEDVEEEDGIDAEDGEKEE